MKSEDEIRTKLMKLTKKLKSEEELYGGIQSRELQRGAYKFIAKTKGQIKSLKWALNETN
jgi:hypothetical protein